MLAMRQSAVIVSKVVSPARLPTLSPSPKPAPALAQFTSVPAGINCDPSCSSQLASYASGTSVTLTAATSSSSTFDGWFGAPGCSTGNTCVVSMTQARNVTATFNISNQAPIAVATISKDGVTYADSITVTRGVATPIYLSAAGSSDPNGWTDATNGVSSGGKCEWNYDLNQGTPPSFEVTKNNPSSASDCNNFTSNGTTTTFNDAPGTYTYQVLRITDKPGAVSNVDTVQVVIQAPANNPPSANNLSVAQPDYCAITWPSAIFSWNFTDSDNDTPQSAYQIQADNNSGFTSPEINTGKIISSSNSYASQSGALSFNTTYYWRLKVWDSKDLSSSWISGAAFATPRHQYPNIDFSWLPQSPTVDENTQFTDSSTVYGGATKSAWSWTFQDGNPANSSAQNPTVRFLSAGNKSITLRVTDSDGLSCQTQKTINSQLPLPDWIEIPPF